MKVNLSCILLVFILVSLFYKSNSQNLRINELMSSNMYTIYDEDNDTPDWIEIVNLGFEDINLADYYLSDDINDTKKWQFPEVVLSPNEYVLVFASDKDRVQKPLFWNTLIDYGDTWWYTIPDSELPTSWKSVYYDLEGWKSGPTGIGYGDDDDNTVVPNGTISIFMVSKFSIDNPEMVDAMKLYMDYDDGFVAYLNGVEVARAGLGAKGSRVAWNQSASGHEALIVNGQEPEGFDISNYTNLLKVRNNVLAIQVHNDGTGSSDLTAIPFLAIGSTLPFDDPHISDYFNSSVVPPHTNFKLSSEGETVYLSSTNEIIDSVRYNSIPGGYSYGRDVNDPNVLGFFSEPTPNEENQSAIFEIVDREVEISPKEMVYHSPVNVVLSGAGDGEVIRYTLDGTVPNINSTQYSSSIRIDKNTPIRARLFNSSGAISKVTSHTYIFDTETTLPIVSIVTDPYNLWDNDYGIYVLGDSYQNQVPYFGANFWEDWERPASIEMFEGSESVFSLNCGIKIFGAWSRAHDQKSLAVFFRNYYSDPVLENVQLFKKKPIKKFKSFVLRNSGNDNGQTRFRDAFMTDLVRDMNIDMAASKPVVLYLNGEYWGHINLREKINEDYLESNHGFDSDSIDILEVNKTVVEGSDEKYLELLDFLEQNNISLSHNYETVSSMMDIENFIDYQLSQIYFNNGDWPGNNIKYWRPQTNDGKWRWILYDTDFGFGQVNTYTYNTLNFATEPNGPNWPNPPWSTFMLRTLLENNQFNNQFINRFADMLNTTFVSEAVNHKIDSIAAIIEPEIPNHASRWGGPSISSWNNNVNTLKTFAINRVDYVQTHIQQKFNLPAIHEISIDFFPQNTGNVKLNTITVARSNWTGEYFEDVPITLTANPYNGYKLKEWVVNGVTMLDETIELNINEETSIMAIFEESENNELSIVINEINYNSPDESNAGDWVELYNWGKSDVDISGWIMKDDDDSHAFIFSENTILRSNEYLVVCRNAENFSLIHPTVLNYLGSFDFGFSSAGDAIRLYSNNEILVDEVFYQSVLPWPSEPNGGGVTLELINPIYDNIEADVWRASSTLLGTPGERNSVITSIDKIAHNNDQRVLNVYPNPFSSSTTIVLENGSYSSLMEIRIFTLDGQLIYRNSISNGEITWDGTSDNGQQLPPGMYVCNVLSEGKMFTKKLVLTK